MRKIASLKIDLSAWVLPLFGTALVVLLWSTASSNWSKTLPSPTKTWEISRTYVLAPLEKRGEMDQGIARFAW